ncbi:MAG: hypothetical protein ACYS83_11655 [Planctomycetota bacterium]|jgi:hypothetical protein
MRTRKILTILGLGLGLAVWAGRVCEAEPMGTAFTYQGRLIEANQAADGEYDFQFKLYDDDGEDSQVGSDVNKPYVDVIGGYFTVELDFGAGVFDGGARWLDIGVRPAGETGVYSTLSPRQKITPAPYSLQTLGPHVDVRAFGVSTQLSGIDNDPNWTKAIEYAYMNKRPLYIPQGTWKFVDAFSLLSNKNHLIIQGAGTGNTVLEHQGDGVAIGFDRCKWPSVRSLRLNCNIGTTDALLVKRTWYGNFEDIHIEGNFTDCNYPARGIHVVGMGRNCGNWCGAYCNTFRSIVVRYSVVGVVLETEDPNEGVFCNANVLINVNTTAFKEVGYKLRFAAVNTIISAQIEGGKRMQNTPPGEYGIELGQMAHSNVFMGGYIESQGLECIHFLGEKNIRNNVFIGQRANNGGNPIVKQEAGYDHTIRTNLLLGSYGERNNYGGDIVRLFGTTGVLHERKIVLRYLDEPNEIFSIDNAGRLEWSDGNSLDTNLYRSGPNELTTNDHLICKMGIQGKSVAPSGIGVLGTATGVGSFAGRFEGDVYVTNDVSALSFTDRTPYPKDLQTAVDAVMSMSPLPEGLFESDDKEQQLDHVTLSPFIRSDDGNRDLSATVSCHNEVLKELLSKQKQLEQASLEIKQLHEKVATQQEQMSQMRKQIQKTPLLEQENAVMKERMLSIESTLSRLDR